VKGGRRARVAFAIASGVFAGGPTARAEDAARPARLTPPVTVDGTADAAILGPPAGTFHVDAMTTRITSFDQFGHGYQAQGGPTPVSSGSERATIFEPTVAIDASQGDRVRHRVVVPIDVVTNASADAIDVVTSASRHVEAGSIDWATTYRVDPESDATLVSGLHLENPFRSWHAGLGGSRAFADGDTVVSAGVLEVFDWFDRFNIHGGRFGRTDRSSTTASVGVTQILTASTIVNVNYGITLQRGQLGNTWNSVPLTTFDRGPELLPGERLRHALVGRVAQYLPWNGALHLYYRFYADDWGLVAHSAEVELLQRLAPGIVVGGFYRFHRQSGVDFFTVLASPDSVLRTADSDLAPFDSQTIGGKVAVDVPVVPFSAPFSALAFGGVRALHVEVGYDHYARTNDLRAEVFTCAVGYRF
jgi:hypothetical protein